MEGIQVSVLTTGSNNNISIIKVGGYIDTTTSAEVERSLDSILQKNRYNVIIDLGNVDYISSAGWGIFISEIKGIREKGGDLKLVNMIPDVYEVFELLEFHYILKAFDTIDDAVNDFEQNSSKSSKESILDIDEEDESKEENNPADLGEEQSSETDMDLQQISKDKSPRSTKDKIVQIIMEKPDSTVMEIKNSLNTEPYDFTKLGVLEVWNLLRAMGLSSKKKRVEYFKKHAFQS